MEVFFLNQTATTEKMQSLVKKKRKGKSKTTSFQKKIIEFWLQIELRIKAHSS